MATTPGDLAGQLSASVVNLYADAEALILEKMAARVAKGIEVPEWETKQLIEVQKFRNETQAILDSLATQSSSVIKSNMVNAAANGHESAKKELTKAMTKGKTLVFDKGSAVQLAAETSTKIKSSHFPILRSTEGAYRDVIARAVTAPLLGVETREQAAQKALNEFAKRGIDGFKDARGRTWRMSTYVEMSMRSALAAAQLAGHAQQLEGMGVNLIIVSDHAQECKLCRPFEGKVLCLKDDSKHMPLSEARSAGLFHPNCRHSFSAYYPGKTKTFGNTADPQGDKDRQQLRYLERKVREQRRLEAVAMDPAAKKKAATRAKAYQAQIAQHVKTTSAVRQPKRERITGNFGSGDKNGLGLPKLPKPAAGVDANPLGKTQLKGSFAPKPAEPAIVKTQLTGSFAPKPPPAVSKYIEKPKMPNEVVNPLTGKTITNPAKLKKLKAHVEGGGDLDGFFKAEAQAKAAAQQAKASVPTPKANPPVNAQALPKANQPLSVDPIAKAKKDFNAQGVGDWDKLSPTMQKIYTKQAEQALKNKGHVPKVQTPPAKKAVPKKAAKKAAPVTMPTFDQLANMKLYQIEKGLIKKNGGSDVGHLPPHVPDQPTKATWIEYLTGKPYDATLQQASAKAMKHSAAKPDPTAPKGSSGNPITNDEVRDAKTYGSTLNENDATKWPKKLAKAVQDYTDYHYVEINGWARGEITKKPRIVDTLDEAFKHPEPLKEWMITTRGTSGLEFKLPAKATKAELDALVGTTRTQEGYMSTSVTTRPAFPGHIQMIVRNPPGSRGIYVDGKYGQDEDTLLTVNPGENEFILPRGAKYRVLAVEPGTNRFAHNVIVEILT